MVGDLAERGWDGLVKGDDLGFHLHLGALEGHGPGLAFLVGQRGEPGPGAQMGQHGVHAVAGSGDGAVDALGGQDQRALHALRLHQGGKRGFARRWVRQGGEMIKGGDGQHVRRLGRLGGKVQCGA